MLKKLVYLAVWTFMPRLLPAQDANVANQEKWPKFSTGFKIRFAYSPNPWRYIQFRNIPESFRAVPDATNPFEIVAQQDFKLHEDSFINFDVGYLVNIGHRLEISAGPSLGLASTAAQAVEFQPGEAFYQINGSGKSWFPGAFGEVNLRLRGPVWFTAQVSTYPHGDDLTFSRGQGFGELGFNQPGYSAQYFNSFPLGKFRYPVAALAGLRICVWGESYTEGQACINILAGPTFREVDLLPNIIATGMEANRRQMIFTVKVGFEGAFHFTGKN